MRSRKAIGRSICRGCGSKLLFDGLILGASALANEMPKEVSNDQKFPLELRVCSKCSLGQVPNLVSPKRLFEDYRYKSNISLTFREHLNLYVDEIHNSVPFANNDWVLEIASNDGVLLDLFSERGFSTLGVEPSKNLSRKTVQAGHHVINKFFGMRVAKNILNEFGFPRLIVANNVLAHVPDINDFFSGIKLLSSDRTLITIENPSILNVLNDNQFDTIYHEHFSYLSQTFIEFLCKQHSLVNLGIKKLPIHGGSNRYYIAKNKTEFNLESLSSEIEHERNSGLLESTSWKSAQEKASFTLNEFRGFLDESFVKGEIVVGYGAAAKCTTILNLCSVSKSHVRYVVDKSEEKQGRYIPGTDIPIVSPYSLTNYDVRHVIIFPWNIASELVKDIRSIFGDEVVIWKAIPAFERVS